MNYNYFTIYLDVSVINLRFRQLKISNLIKNYRK